MSVKHTSSLVRSQTETRITSLVTGGKIICITKWQGIYLNCVLLGASTTCKQWTWMFSWGYFYPSVEGLVWFLLVSYFEMQEEGNKLEKELLIRKWEVEIVSQSVLHRIKKACSEVSTKVQQFAKERGMWLVNLMTTSIGTLQCGLKEMAMR